MRAQQAAVGQIERVVHGSRRVVRRNIEGFEVVIVVFDLGSPRDIEAGVQKNRFDAGQGQADRMGIARQTAAPRQRHIDAVTGQGLLQLRFV